MEKINEAGRLMVMKVVTMGDMYFNCCGAGSPGLPYLCCLTWIVSPGERTIKQVCCCCCCCCCYTGTEEDLCAARSTMWLTD